jgi:proteasome assembly chaperone (PAC2) family protein
VAEDGLTWETRPQLRDPLLVAAFEGWNDAGDAASGAADWLVRRKEATRFASIDPEEHIDYQSRRPTLRLEKGVASSITWPANVCYAVGFPERDVVVVRGVEPNVRWKSFCNAVLTVASDTGCTMVVTLGALLGDVPHTRSVRITGTATDPDLIASLGLMRSRYEGPTGIVGVLHDVCQTAGVRSASLWAPVPHYISQPPNPPATLALLQRFGALARINFDLTGLDGLVDMWRLQVDQAIDDNDEVKTYVRELEARVDAESAADEGVLLGDDDLPSGDQLADELQRYLRDQGDE